MARCVNYKTGKRCPALYECTENHEYLSGAVSVEIDGQPKEIHMVIHDPDTENKTGELERYCFYCMATKRGKKIGSKASWTALTPKWCPMGRDEG